MFFVVSIIGPSESGKTTLIEQIIGKLSERGFAVAAIKCAHHQIDLDRPGKDSYRLKKAGAVSVGLVSPGKWAVIADDAEISLNDLLAKLPPSDLVIIEGGSRFNIPKIEILPPPINQPSKSPPDDLIALVGENLHHENVPCFNSDDISGITEFLVGFKDNKSYHRL
jgi:molybdopterin-guanine dinucleotide biosynthesis protein B